MPLVGRGSLLERVKAALYNSVGRCDRGLTE